MSRYKFLKKQVQKPIVKWWTIEIVEFNTVPDLEAGQIQSYIEELKNMLIFHTMIILMKISLPQFLSLGLELKFMGKNHLI